MGDFFIKKKIPKTLKKYVVSKYSRNMKDMFSWPFHLITMTVFENDNGGWVPWVKHIKSLQKNQ